MVRGLEISVISNHVLDAEWDNAGAPLQSGQHHVNEIPRYLEIYGSLCVK